MIREFQTVDADCRNQRLSYFDRSIFIPNLSKCYS